MTKANNNKKRRPSIPNKVKANLQKEISSKCPFCLNEDVDHFEIHHIDENPSNNDFTNLLMVCPTCHSKITKKDISFEEVVLKKQSLNKQIKPLNIFSSKEIFKSKIKALTEDKNSDYYNELKEHWNCYTLIDGLPVLNEILRENLAKTIDFGILPLMVDIINKHLYYDREMKYIYNQPHISKHNGEDEGWDLPLYFHIRCIGILYATAIVNKIDIATLSRHNRNMISIFSGIINGIIANLIIESCENKSEYPTNYHWLLCEIFSLMRNWLYFFNEKENFETNSNYKTFIPDCINSCLLELYKAVNAKKITIEFLVQRLYYGVFLEYFSFDLNDELKSSLEELIIAKIPNELIEPVLEFSLDEAFAIDYKKFCQGNFRVHNQSDKIPITRLRDFLARTDKI